MTGTGTKVLFVVAAMSISCPAVAKGFSDIFSETWDARQVKYDAELSSSHGRLETAVAGVAKSLTLNDASFGPALENLIHASIGMGYASGRSGAIKSLRVLMKGKPKQIAIELWLQEQANNLQRSSEEASDRLGSAKAMRPGENGATVNSQLQSITLGYIVAGTVKGAADELLLIKANLGTFLTAKNAQDQRRRDAAAAIFEGMSEYSRSLTASRPPPSWTATCSVTGGFTRCHGQ